MPVANANAIAAANPAAAPPERPIRLVEHYLIPLPDGVQIRAAGRVTVLRGLAVQQALPLLLPLLDGTRAESQILGAFDGPVERKRALSLIKVLREKGFIEEVVDLPPALAGGGHASLVRYYGGTAVPVALRDAHIVVTGDAASAAAPLAQALGHSAVGRVTIAGPDGVPDLAGVSLAIALCDRSIVLDPRLTALNDAAIEAGVPWLPVAFIGDRAAQIGPTVVPGLTACLACLHDNLARQTAFLLPYDLSAALAAAAPPGAPSAADLLVALAIAAVEATRVVSPGQDAATYGRILTLRFADLSIERQNVPRVPRCAACGATRNRPKMRIWG